MVRLAIDGGLAHASLADGARRGGRRWSAIAVGRGLFNFLQGYLAERASQGVAFDLRDGAVRAHPAPVSFSYYDQAQTGQLLTRLTNDVEQVRTFVGGGVVQLAASLVMLLGCAVLLFVINPALAARRRWRTIAADLLAAQGLRRRASGRCSAGCR